jgi:NADH:ubiquinone oxidoreductase subunit 6 (subunit J)
MISINWPSLFFLLFALIACVFAVAVVVTGNIVRMACYLVVSLSAVAGLFFLAGAEFLGAVQLLVYVGGTMVLLVFGVMLTARGPFVSMRTGGGQWVMAVIIVGALLAILLPVTRKVEAWNKPLASESAETTAPPASETAQLGMGLLGVRTERLQTPPPKSVDGMSGYVLLFEIISVHLLVVLIGAAYLARARRNKTEA